MAALVAASCTGPDEAESRPASDELPAAEATPGDLAALESPHVGSPLRNEFVHVHRVDLPAGAALAAHEGGERVIYSLTAYRVAFDTDGRTETGSFEPGVVHQHGAGVHTVENVGDTEASFLIFERRDAALPSTVETDGTEIPAASQGAEDEIVFGSDLAEVHRVTLQPDAALPSHRGSVRAIYSMSDYEVEFTTDADTRRQSFSAGDAHYHDAGSHSVRNVGENVAEFLVVEFLR